MILFLDFDGVLHPQYDGQAVPKDVAFCHLPRFEAVMRDFPQVDIVISSTWRTQFALEGLRAWFSPDIARRIIGVTPCLVATGLPVPPSREQEILQWMSMNQRTNEPWVAVDDMEWEFKAHRSKLVPCKSFLGFDDLAAQLLRQRLDVLE